MLDPGRRFLLALIGCGFAVLSLLGITWGLPSRAIDPFLFPDGNVWSGEKIHRLSGAEAKLAPDRAAFTGADVDVDPLRPDLQGTIRLTETDEDAARILLRYRLYTFQPDEMITMMALSGMRPGRLEFDPRLYQYGGLFIYPVGGLIGLCGFLGLIDVRGDLVFYLDHPDEFGKFYVVARLYAAAWGILGVVVVFAITRRLMGDGGRSSRAGLLAALLFTLLPVVVCMAHEAKPHLPGAVLMLCAVLFGMRSMRQTEVAPANRDWWLMCVCCGAAFGMVLSAWPILVLVPLVAVLTADKYGFTTVLKRILFGGLAAAAVYLATNPYILINAFKNSDVLKSNFGNSLAMYDIARIAEGFSRVLELTVEGATLPIVVLGAISFAAVLIRRNRIALVLTVPAAVFFLQFVLIGAGKPAEYGRFGIFTNTALAIGTACLIASQWPRRRSIALTAATTIVVCWVGWGGMGYLANFQSDTTPEGSRLALAKLLNDWLPDASNANRRSWRIDLMSEPAPYSCPPLDFANLRVVLLDQLDRADNSGDARRILLHPVDHGGQTWFKESPTPWWSNLLRPETPISWANKPFVVDLPGWRPTGQGP